MNRQGPEIFGCRHLVQNSEVFILQKTQNLRPAEYFHHSHPFKSDKKPTIWQLSCHKRSKILNQPRTFKCTSSTPFIQNENKITGQLPLRGS